MTSCTARPGLPIRVLAVALAGALAGASAPAGAEVPAEAEFLGKVETLPAPRPHWAWSTDPVLERAALVDLESGDLLGVVDGGWGVTVPVFAADGGEIYLPETHYSRGSRGDRTDVVTFYDSRSLAPTGEVVLPPKRAISAVPAAHAALGDEGRFLAVYNMTPATSVSIVDVRERRFAGEIPTPGCSLVYPAGPRRFLMLCMDGSALAVELDERGAPAALRRSAPFFDPRVDPVTEKAARMGDTWLFASFEGQLHAVDVSGPELRFEAPWSLLSDADRAGSWRVGGSQHLAVHERSGRLYSLVHQGGVDSHKQPGTEVWVYDLETRERIQRVELRNPGFTYLGVSMEFGRDWIWPFNHLYDGLLALANLGVDSISVTGDEEPLLLTSSIFTGALATYDALSGDFRRRVVVGNMTNIAIRTPYGHPRLESP
ncbi:MAG: amine dehydrogenase large subunit [Myxococcota bacterium]